MSLSCLWSRAAHGQARFSSAFSTSFSLGRRTSLARLDRAVKARGGSLRFIRAIASRNSTARIGRPPLSYRTASASLRSCWPFSLRRPKLPVYNDPSARNLLLADPKRPHRQPVLIPGQAVSFADRHEFVGRFENSDRAGYVTVPDLALMADMCEERLAHGATDRGLTLRKGDQTSQGSASSIIVPSS